MKILFCIAGLSAGGGERQFLRLVKGAAAQGHEVMVHVFGNHDSVHYKEIYELPNFFSEIKRGTRFRAPYIILRDMRRLLKDFQPDIVFGTLHKASVAVRLAKFFGFTDAKVVTSMRTDYQKLYSPFRKSLESILVRFSDVWVTNHKPSAEIFKAIAGDKVKYIANGIDDSDIASKEYGDELPHAHGLRLLSVGSLYVPYKNQIEMFKALAQVIKKTDAQFEHLCVGGGAHEAELNKLIEDLKLSEVIQILPPLENVADYYHASDALFHGAIIEGCPNVVLEAMLCGKPVICSKYVGDLGIVEDNVSGVVAESDDADGLADALLRYIKLSESERMKMGECARKNILDNFSTQEMVSKHLELFSELLEK